MNSATDRLRKAAIFVASLDEAAAAGVYASLAPTDAEQLRSAVAELSEFDSEEQEAILAEFLAERSRHAEDVGVELDRNLARRLADYERDERGDASNSPVACDDVDELSRLSTEELVDGLEGEHPQTIAVVLARVEPARAADTLRTWGPERRHEILRRIAGLAPTPPEVVREIAQELFERLRRRAEERSAARRSEAQVEAILAAVDEPLRAAWRDEAHGRSTESDENESSANGASEGVELLDTASMAPASPESSPAGSAARSVESFRETEVAVPGAASGVEPTPLTWSDVTRFDDHVLARLFASAAPELVRLALAGSDESLLARMRRHLGAAAARALDRQIHRLDAVRIGDIVEAQERLAELAERLARRGELTPR